MKNSDGRLPPTAAHGSLTASVRLTSVAAFTLMVACASHTGTAPRGASSAPKAKPLAHLYGKDVYPCTDHPVCDRRSPPDGVLSVTYAGFETLDPNLIAETEGFFVAENLFEGLVKKGPDGRTVPGVAERWEASKDGRVWTFHLRKAAKWSDGRRVTAQDFVFSWLRTMGPELASFSAETLTSIVKNGESWSKGLLKDASQVGVRAEGAGKLVVTLHKPTPHLAEHLKSTAFAPVPRHVVTERGKAWTQTAYIVTNGAYQVRDRQPEGDVVLTRNRHYWDASSVRIRTVRLRYFRSQWEAWKSYDNGEVHWYRFPVERDLGDELRADGRPDLLIDPFNCVYYYGFNTQRPPFDNPAVRRAFNMAIDKQALVTKVLRRAQPPATTLVPPWLGPTTGYRSPKTVPFDPAAARRLLAAAGYPGGQGFPEVRLSYNTFERHRRIARFVADQLRTHLNVTVVPDNMEWKTLLRRLRTGDFQLTRFGWCAINDASGFLKPFGSKSPHNYVGFSDGPFDALLERSDRAMNAARRMEVLAKAESRLLDAMPIAPLYHYTRAYLKVPVLRGFAAEPGNTHLFQYMSWGDIPAGRRN